MLNIKLIPILEDNYCYVIQSGDTVGLVDVGDATPVINYLEEHNLTPTILLTTHHHWDHIDGIEDIKNKYNLHHIAAQKDTHRIPLIDQAVSENEIIKFGDEEVQIIETNGHTMNHINFYFKDSKVLFSGDTLFAMGCGRLFEGTAENMFKSFEKLKNLSNETKIYCGHEYTQSNGKFALKIEPSNQDIIDRMKSVKNLRKQNIPTIPTTIELEKKTNVFMRAQDAATFKKYRDLKDKS